MLTEELGLEGSVHPPTDNAPSLQDPALRAVKAGLSGELADELDLSFLPDELSVQEDRGMTSTQ